MSDTASVSPGGEQENQSPSMVEKVTEQIAKHPVVAAAGVVAAGALAQIASKL